MAARMHNASMSAVTADDVALRIAPNGTVLLQLGDAQGTVTLYPPAAIGEVLEALEQLRAVGHAITRQCNTEIDRLARERAHAAIETSAPDGSLPTAVGA
jgi:hypothetical protein